MFKTYINSPEVLFYQGNADSLKRILKENISEDDLKNLLSTTDIEVNYSSFNEIKILRYFSVIRIGDELKLKLLTTRLEEIVAKMPLGVGITPFINSLFSVLDVLSVLLRKVITSQNASKIKDSLFNAAVLSLLNDRLEREYECYLSPQRYAVAFPHLRTNIKLLDDTRFRISRTQGTIYVGVNNYHPKETPVKFVEDLLSIGELQSELRNISLTSLFTNADPTGNVYDLSFFRQAIRWNYNIEPQLDKLLSADELVLLELGSIEVNVSFGEEYNNRSEEELDDRFIYVHSSETLPHKELIFHHCLKTPQFLCLFKNIGAIEIIRTNDSVLETIMEHY